MWRVRWGGGRAGAGRRMRFSVRSNSNRDLRTLAQTAPQAGGGLLERICPVEPFSIVPRRLAGGCSTPPGRRNVTERRSLRDPHHGTECVTARMQSTPFGEVQYREPVLVNLNDGSSNACPTPISVRAPLGTSCRAPTADASAAGRGYTLPLGSEVYWGMALGHGDRTRPNTGPTCRHFRRVS